jgi:hypothetical protein
VLHPELAVFVIFLYEFFAAWKQPKNQCNSFKGVLPKSNAAKSPGFEAKRI